jgi:hypothetical protein
MANQLEVSIARILSLKGTPVGAGFLVAEGYVLTCAHVVAQALEIPLDTSLAPTETITLDFPLTRRDTRLVARAIFWEPFTPETSISQEKSRDIAVLELNGELPEGVQPIQLASAQDSWGHQFRALGFPVGRDGGVWASGILRALQADGWVQIEDIKAEGYRVEAGFSGTPIWDEVLKGVVGMAVMAERSRPETKVAFIIPADVLTQVCINLNILQAQASVEHLDPKRSRIFVSYKRNIDPDETIAHQIFQALSQQHDVFIDRTMLVGERWAGRIKAEIQQADVLIVLLSEHSVHSEMVEQEIELAHNLAAEHNGRPAILPVRLAYREPFQYPLCEYLDPINWAFWNNSDDTDRLITELSQAIAGHGLSIASDVAKQALLYNEPSEFPRPFASAQPRLEDPEGTMDVESKFYVKRPEDKIALEKIQGQVGVIVIKAPRQMGKSSLLMRTIAAAMEAEKQVIFLDFQSFDRATLLDGERFYREFCTRLSDELGIPNRLDDYWKEVSNSKRGTDYMLYLLQELQQPLVLAMDEVDRIFQANFRSDFFSMLRSWFNNRANPKTRIWKKLDMVLVTSTEPYQLIADLHQSPFNVGTILNLQDFTPDRVTYLNRQHGSPLNAAREKQLIDLLGGHPYLVRKALYLVASREITIPDLFAQASTDHGPFGDHLRRHLFRMSDRKDLIQGMLQVIRKRTRPDEQVLWRLQRAGLVRESGNTVLPRCRLYADYFLEHLHG